MYGGLSTSDKIEALSLCYSESPFDYMAKHSGNYIDVCGVKPHWRDYIKEQGLKPNTIRAGYEVYRFYLEKNNGDKVKALKEFKGIESKDKMWIVKKVLDTTKEVKKYNLKAE